MIVTDIILQNDIDVYRFYMEVHANSDILIVNIFDNLYFI